MRKLQGIIVGDKMIKTRVVEISRLKQHPRYHKFFRITKRFKAHDENNEYKLGDEVVIQEVRPISRDKRWKIIELATKNKSTTNLQVKE